MDDQSPREYFRQRINNIFISLTTLGQAVWITPRTDEKDLLPAPKDGMSGKLYRGANALRLLSIKRADPRWVPLSDIEQNGWMVKEQAPTPSLLVGENGSWTSRRVCNAADVIGFPALELPAPSHRDPVAMAKAMIASYGVTHVEGDGSGYYYGIADDSLKTPRAGAIRNVAEHESAVIYQLLHADGHEKRSQRDFGRTFMSREYAEEALRTHVAALFVSSRLRLPFTPSEVHDYRDNWLDLVARDPDTVLRISRDAEQMAGRFVDQFHAVEQRLAQERPLPEPQRKYPRTVARAEVPKDERIYLFTLFEEKERVKALGAQYDKDQKKFYIPASIDRKPFEAWLQPPPAISLQNAANQFRCACEKLGLNMTGVDINADGLWHGVTVTSSSNTKKTSGRYMLECDLKRGSILNLDTGIGAPWRVDGQMIDDEKTREQMEINRQNQEKARAAQQKAQEKAEAECEKRWAALPPARNHPYIERKGVPIAGLKQWGKDLAIPMYNVAGAVRNIQRIAPEQGGPKLYQKDARKQGLFFVYGDLASASTVFFVEGYATGGSIHMATGMAVVVCFDSGNIEAAMHALRDKIPAGADKIICADNDLVEPWRLAATLNGKKREQLGYPEVKEDLVEFCRATGEMMPLISDSDWLLKVNEIEDASHYEQTRLEAEIWLTGPTGAERKHRAVVNNGGMEKALAAAAAEGAKVVSALFKDQNAYRNGHKDFNDLHKQEGLEAVQWQLASVVDLVKGRQFAEERARELKYNLIQVRPEENDARHTGKVVLHAGCHAVQEIGRNTAVAHAYANLDRVPPNGMTQIKYRDGKGVVVDQRNKSKEAERIER